jgi:hypothetical protein
MEGGKESINILGIVTAVENPSKPSSRINISCLFSENLEKNIIIKSRVP